MKEPTPPIVWLLGRLKPPMVFIDCVAYNRREGLFYNGATDCGIDRIRDPGGDWRPYDHG